MQKKLAIEQQVRHQLSEFLEQYQLLDIVLAVSGGADSMAMLAIVAEFRMLYPECLNICVVHVNHGLSPNADQWQSLVEQQCSVLKVPCISRCVSIHTDANIEEQARHQRYAVFQTVMQQRHAQYPEHFSLLALGHHGNDVAENYILRLMRGSGPLGLSSMKMLEDHYLGFVVWRPFLDGLRADIEAYVMEKKQAFVNDESNADERLNRNFIRNTVLPVLGRRWPHAVDSIVCSQRYHQEAAAVLDDMAQLDLEQCEVLLSPAAISALHGQVLLQKPAHRFKNLIRYWLKSQGVDQLRNAIYGVVQDGVHACVTASSSRHRLKITVDFKKSLYLGFSKGCLYLYQQRQALQQLRIPCNDLDELQAKFGVEFIVMSEFALKSENTAQQPYCHDHHIMCQHGRLYFPVSEDLLAFMRQSPAEADQKYFWRASYKGEKIRLKSKPYAMKLSKLWLEWQVPSAIRFQWPLLVDQQDKVVFIPGCYSDLPVR